MGRRSLQVIAELFVDVEFKRAGMMIQLTFPDINYNHLLCYSPYISINAKRTLLTTQANLGIMIRSITIAGRDMAIVGSDDVVDNRHFALVYYSLDDPYFHDYHKRKDRGIYPCPDPDLQKLPLMLDKFDLESIDIPRIDDCRLFVGIDYRNPLNHTIFDTICVTLYGEVEEEDDYDPREDIWDPPEWLDTLAQQW